MASDLHVEVALIDRVEKHPNADLLDLVHVKGWQLVTQKGLYKRGDKIVYVPPDSVLPLALSDELGVTQYLHNGRVKCIKLRKEPSFGLTMAVKDASWPVGLDVAEEYGITKYAPPVRNWQRVSTTGKKRGLYADELPEHPLFWQYTSIDNLRHYPNEFADGEEVIVTEKLHGTNSRVGVIDGVFMAGSHKVQRRHPNEHTYTGPFAFIKRLWAKLTRRKPPADSMSLKNSRYVYWFPVFIPEVQNLLTYLAGKHKQVILYGEILGDTVQSLDYGYVGGLGYRAFDLLIDGHFLNYDDFRVLCQQYNVPTVPLLARIPYSFDLMKRFSEGKTTLLDPKQKPHIREGVVVKPVIERDSPKVGRLILKYVSDSYLVGKATDFTEE